MRIMRYLRTQSPSRLCARFGQDSRLNKAIDTEMAEDQKHHQATQKPARVLRTFTIERARVGRMNGGWWVRRVLAEGENPRFIVTSIQSEQIDARALYEDFFCARGEMENRIKEQQLGLFADRTSTSWMRSNQLRLYFSSFAYILVHALRRVGLTGTELANAQCDTIRLKLF